METTEVTVGGIKAEVRPSGVCALLIPDDPQATTLQESIDYLDRPNVALFAAVQAAEWGTDINSGNHGSAQSVAWKRIYTANRHPRGRRRGI
jgi:hypothetical protein